MHDLCPAGERRDRAARLLAEVGLAAAHLDRYPHQLSGGQRQRVAIARALAVDPRLLVCDEPVSALDRTVAAQVLDLLGRIRRERGLALLFIGHDLEAVGAVSEQVAVMKDGRIVERGPADQVLRAPATPYAQKLVAAMPRRGAERAGMVEAAFHPSGMLLPGDPDPRHGEPIAPLAVAGVEVAAETDP